MVVMVATVPGLAILANSSAGAPVADGASPHPQARCLPVGRFVSAHGEPQMSVDSQAGDPRVPWEQCGGPAVGGCPQPSGTLMSKSWRWVVRSAVTPGGTKETVMLLTQRVHRNTHGAASVRLSAPPSTSSCLPRGSTGCCSGHAHWGQIRCEPADRGEMAPRSPHADAA